MPDHTLFRTDSRKIIYPVQDREEERRKTIPCPAARPRIGHIREYPRGTKVNKTTLIDNRHPISSRFTNGIYSELPIRLSFFEIAPLPSPLRSLCSLRKVIVWYYNMYVQCRVMLVGPSHCSYMPQHFHVPTIVQESPPWAITWMPTPDTTIIKSKNSALL